MRWRHLRPGEFNHELLWLAVTLTAGLIGCLWLWNGLPVPQCVWHNLTGLPCPGCGGTRCARAILHGFWLTALAMNPMVFIGFTLTAIYNAYAAVVLALRLPRLRFDEMPGWVGWTTRIGVVAAVLLNWAWLIVERR